MEYLLINSPLERGRVWRSAKAWVCYSNCLNNTALHPLKRGTALALRFFLYVVAGSHIVDPALPCMRSQILVPKTLRGQKDLCGGREGLNAIHRFTKPLPTPSRREGIALGPCFCLFY